MTSALVPRMYLRTLHNTSKYGLFSTATSTLRWGSSIARPLIIRTVVPPGNVRPVQRAFSTIPGGGAAAPDDKKKKKPKFADLFREHGPVFAVY
jgi:hypothetical protein